MARGTLQTFATMMCLGTLAGCAAVQSQATISGKPISDGIPYYLPLRPFVITITNPVSGPPTIAVANGPAVPDPSRPYTLSQGTNLLANNEFNVGVSPNGLLQSSTSTATSQVAAAVQNAAASAAIFAPGVGGVGPLFGAAFPQLAAVAARAVGQAVPASIACPPRGGPSYQVVVYPDAPPAGGPLKLCDDADVVAENGPYTVTWHQVPPPSGLAVSKIGDHRLANTETPVPGLFFRHELSYVVTVQGPSSRPFESDFPVTSPDESETDFFPVQRSFFANNTAKITATDGVITAVDQTTQSEVAAAVGMPAAWVSSYTTALGQLLTGLTSISSDQQKLLQQTLATASVQNQTAVVAAVQNLLCARTVSSYGNLGALSQSDLAAAQTAIKAACPGN